jgi:hypothetical protein
MRISWNQMIILGSAALFFTAYTTQNAMAQGESLAPPAGSEQPPLNIDEMESLVPEESTLTPEEEMKLRVDEENVFDETPPG